MNPKEILTIFRRECLSAIRDRRALNSSLAYAVMGPAILALALSASMKRQAEPQAFMVALQGIEAADTKAVQDDLDDLRERLVVSQLAVVHSNDATQAVQHREALVGLVVESDAQAQLNAGAAAKVAVVYDVTHAGAQAAADRVKGIVLGWGSDLAGARLISRGVAPSVTAPVRLSERDLATREARAGLALAALPLFLLMAVFVCGLPAALDGTAGERERGSLEPLLLSPVSRFSIAVGKWLAASLMAALGVVVTLGVAVAVFRMKSLAELPFALDRFDVAAILIGLLPVALLASAIQAFIGLQSKTFKEAQAQGNLLILVPMVPGFLVSFGASLPEAAAFTPIIGHQLLVEGILKGQNPGMLDALILSALTLSIAAGVVVTMSRQLNREATRLT
jgi:sodium transport system permease protein